MHKHAQNVVQEIARDTQLISTGKYKSYTSISMAHFYAKRLKCAQTWITVLPANCTMPAFTPQPQSITALWLELIYRPTKGRRLSRPGWLVTYRNKVPSPGVKPGHGHPSQY